MGSAFWQSLKKLLISNTIHIDRPRGTPHPRYNDMIYPLDYGFVENTSAGDGDGIDVWRGSLAQRELTGILCTFDTVKRDAEIKLLSGCSPQDVQIILNFYEKDMGCIFIPVPQET